jgi:branched-chain amino acid transport system substrate-binding protein
MERKWKKIIGMAFITFFSVFILVQPPMAADFKIGYCVPITGSVAKLGAANIRGATLAAKEINAAGGVAGFKLELLIEDSKCVPTEGINVAERFVEKDKVDVLMGEVCSSTTIAILEVVKRTKKPLVVTTSTAPEITAPTAPTKGYVYRLVPTNDLLSAQLAEVLIDQLKFNKISLVTDVGNEWSVTLRNLFKNHMEKRGLKSLSEESIQPGETDFYSVISKVKAVKPAGVFANMQGVELVNFTRQAHESGLKTQLFSAQAASDPATQKAMGIAMEGMIFLSFYEPTN